MDLHPGKPIESFELFAHTLLLKQAGTHPLLINLFTLKVNGLDRDIPDDAPYTFIDNFIVVLEKRNIYMYDLKGKLVKKIEKTSRSIEDYNSNDICCSKNQQYLAITWKNKINKNTLLQSNRMSASSKENALRSSDSPYSPQSFNYETPSRKSDLISSVSPIIARTQFAASKSFFPMP